MSAMPALHVRDRAAVLAAAIVALHGIVVLIGWTAGWSPFVTPSARFIPMAPTTALAFLFISFALVARIIGTRGTVLRHAGTVTAWVVGTMALVNIGLPTFLDALIRGTTGQFAAVPLAIAIAAPGSRSHYAGALATVSAIVGATVALGYAYGTPLLYGSSTIPVALPTGLSLLILGLATIAATGPEVWPLEPLLGDAPRARMLRAFLPATAGLVILIGLLDARFGGLFGSDRVLIAAWFAVLGAALVTLLVSRLSRRIANEIERANAEHQRAERRYRDIFEQSVCGVSTTRVSDGRVLLCNEALARIFGYDSAAEFMEQRARNLWWAP